MKPRTYRPIDPSGCEPQAVRSDIQPALRGFQDVLIAAGRSRGTQRVYLSLVRRWLEAGGAPGHLDSALFARWLREYRAGVSQSQVNGVIKACRAFYRAMAACGHCTPGEDQKLPAMRRVVRQLPRYLTAEQLAAVLAAPDVSTWMGLRDHTVLRVLAETGLRTGELAALRLGDLLDDGMLHVAHVRRDRARYVPMSTDLRALLACWIRRRCEVHPGKRQALFVTVRGLPLGVDGLWRIVDKHARAALGRALGIGQLAQAGKPWAGHSPHLLRASLAVAWHQRGIPLPSIAQLLGHADVATTAHYVAVDLEQLRAAVAHHPRSRSATR